MDTLSNFSQNGRGVQSHGGRRIKTSSQGHGQPTFGWERQSSLSNTPPGLLSWPGSRPNTVGFPPNPSLALWTCPLGSTGETSNGSLPAARAAQEPGRWTCPGPGRSVIRVAPRGSRSSSSSSEDGVGNGEETKRCSTSVCGGSGQQLRTPYQVEGRPPEHDKTTQAVGRLSPQRVLGPLGHLGAVGVPLVFVALVQAKWGQQPPSEVVAVLVWTCSALIVFGAWDFFHRHLKTSQVPRPWFLACQAGGVSCTLILNRGDGIILVLTAWTLALLCSELAGLLLTGFTRSTDEHSG